MNQEFEADIAVGGWGIHFDDANTTIAGICNSGHETLLA